MLKPRTAQLFDSVFGDEEAIIASSYQNLLVLNNCCHRIKWIHPIPNQLQSTDNSKGFRFGPISLTTNSSCGWSTQLSYQHQRLADCLVRGVGDLGVDLVRWYQQARSGIFFLSRLRLRITQTCLFTLPALIDKHNEENICTLRKPIFLYQGKRHYINLPLLCLFPILYKQHEVS